MNSDRKHVMSKSETRLVIQLQLWLFYQVAQKKQVLYKLGIGK